MSGSVISKPNKYRKWLWKLLACLWLTVVVNHGIKFLSLMGIEAQLLGISTDLSSLEIIDRTNAVRRERGLGELIINEKLNRAALTKGQAMMKTDTFSHNVADKSPWEFLSTEKYDYLMAGENLARNFTKSSDVVAAWLISPSHRDNLLNPEYSEIGVAVLDGGKDKNKVIIVQYLAKPFYEKYITPRDKQLFYSLEVVEPIISLSAVWNKYVYILLALVFLGTIFRVIYVKRTIIKKGRLPSRYYWGKT